MLAFSSLFIPCYNMFAVHHIVFSVILSVASLLLICVNINLCVEKDLSESTDVTGQY
jgi:hypothetical protein